MTRKRKFRLGFRAKSVLFVASPMLAVAVFMMFYFPSSFRRAVHEEVEAKAKTVAELFQFTMATAVNLRANDRIDRVLSWARDNEDVVLLAIYDYRKQVADLGHTAAGTDISEVGLDALDRPIGSGGSATTRPAAAAAGTLLKEWHASWVPSPPPDIRRESCPYGFFWLCRGGAAEIFYKESELKVGGNVIGAILVGFSKANFTKQVGRNRNRVIIVSLSTLLLGLVLAIVFGSFTTRPIQRLTTHATRIAGGDLKQVDLRVHTRDEIEELAKGFQKMTHNLTFLIKRVSNTARDINRLADQINQIAAEQSSGITQQSAALNEIGSTIEELAQTAYQIEQNAQSVMRDAENTFEKARSNQQTVEVLIRRMQETHEAAKIGTEKIVQLGVKSKNIGEILSFIKDVADQTKLLSLNATIEAARAGEAGKGFNVLATEISRLAQNVKDSLGEIRPYLEEITESITESVAATGESSRRLNEGLNQAAHAQASLEEIQQLMQTTLRSIQQNLASVQQQKSASQQVVESVRELSEVSRRAAQSSQETTQTTDKLTRVADQLMVAVKQFRLGESEGDRRDKRSGMVA